MNKGEILVTIHEMRGECAHDQKAALMRVGRAVVEDESSTAFIQVYHEAKAKVMILDELLEKIENTLDDIGEVKNNSFCNHSIYDSAGNEIARAKRMD